MEKRTWVLSAKECVESFGSQLQELERTMVESWMKALAVETSTWFLHLGVFPAMIDPAAEGSSVVMCSMLSRWP